MKLDDGQVTLPSIMGTIFTFLTFLCLIGYTVQKFDILISRKDVDIALNIKDHHFGVDNVFTGKQGLNIAIAFSGFDEIRENVLKPEYASLKFEYSEWEIAAESGKIAYLKYEIKSHTCSAEELGLEGNDPQFMPIHETSLEFVRSYQ